MIKRRFYRTEHGDKDDDSSSSSDSEIEPQSPQDSDSDQPPSLQSHHHDDVDDLDDDDDDHVDGPTSLKPMSPSSSSSGYESEDSSINEIDEDSPDLVTNDDDEERDRDGKQIDTGLSSRKESDTTDQPDAGGVPNCVLKCKSVFKCRLCPKIVCLNQESLNTHLKSKRHARSEKLLNNGKLKRVLNSDGEEVVFSDDEDGETHAERHARIMALAQSTTQKKVKGRQRQRQRLKRKKENVSNTKNSNQQKDNRAKRRRKNAVSTS